MSDSHLNLPWVEELFGRRPKRVKKNRVLAEVDGEFTEGLAVKRLERLADFIEGLEVMDTRLPGRAIRGVSMYDEVAGYMLTARVNRQGTVWGKEPSCELDVLGKGVSHEGAYYVTGYGLICWGWGSYTHAHGRVRFSMTMNAVANELKDELIDVLMAFPVRTEQIPGFAPNQITGTLVADALRHFLQCRDPLKAWRLANGLQVDARPAPHDRWKQLLIEERYDAMLELSAAQVSRLEGELAPWTKRLAKAETLAQSDMQRELSADQIARNDYELDLSAQQVNKLERQLYDWRSRLAKAQNLA